MGRMEPNKAGSVGFAEVFDAELPARRDGGPAAPATADLKAVGTPANDLIDSAERRRRQEATDFARASVGLEGFKLTKEDEEQTRRFVNGEIELAEFLKAE